VVEWRLGYQGVPSDLIKTIKSILMKNKLFILIIALIPFQGIAQEDIFDPGDTVRFQNDMLVVNLLSSTWLNAPEGVEMAPVSISSEFYYMFPLFGKNSNISMAAGLGVSCENYHNNSLPGLDSNDATVFTPHTGNHEYTKNKLSVSYIDIPLEFRFRTNPNEKKRSFKISLGFRGGYLVADYIKYVGEDFRTNTGKIVKFKEYRIENLSKIRYGAFARIGYGKVNLICNYTLSQFFEKDKGPEMVPLTFGLSFTIM
jgi:hypothetical protein